MEIKVGDIVQLKSDSPLMTLDGGKSRPCDKCPYFWEENNRSCRDECQEYKAWLAGNKSNMADTFLYGPRIEASPK